MKKQKRQKTGRVLGAYRKLGTKFIPPLLAMPMQPDFVSWARHAMPELVWWDVIAHAVSQRFAWKLAEVIAGYLKERDNRNCRVPHPLRSLQRVG